MSRTFNQNPIQCNEFSLKVLFIYLCLKKNNIPTKIRCIASDFAVFNKNPTESVIHLFIFEKKNFLTKQPMHYIGFCCLQQKSDVVHWILVVLDYFKMFFFGEKKRFSYQQESDTVHRI